MDRATLMRLLGFCLVALVAVGVWKITMRYGLVAEEMPSPRVIETNRLMEKWSDYAKGVKLAKAEALLPAEAVDLMNKRRTRAFPGQAMRFVFWQAGDPVPPGFVLNPEAARWTEEDQKTAAARMAKSGQSDRIRLRQQTDLLLNEYGCRIQLIEGNLLVFRKDAFLPHLITRTIYFSNLTAVRASVGAQGLKEMLDRKDIYMGPGTSATYAPERQAIILRVDEADLDRASKVCQGLGVQESAWKNFKAKLRSWRDGY